MVAAIKIIWAARAISSVEQFLQTVAMAPEGRVLQVSPCTSQLTESLPYFPLRKGVYSMENSTVPECRRWYLARSGMVHIRVGAESHDV